MKHRLLAGFLSFFITGLGQFYHLQYKLGLLLILIQSALFGYTMYGAFLTGGYAILYFGPIILLIQLVGAVLAIFYTRVEKKSIFRRLNHHTLRRLTVGIVLVIITHIVAYVISAPESISSKEEEEIEEATIQYLEEKYNEQFTVSEISPSEEPYDTTAYIEAHPASNEDLVISLKGDFKSLEIYYDNYQSSILSYEVTSILEEKAKSLFKDQTLFVSADVNAVNEESKVSYEEIRKNYSNDIESITVNFALFEEVTEENHEELREKLYEMILLVKEFDIDDPDIDRTISWDVFTKDILSDESITYYKERGIPSFRGEYSDDHSYYSMFHDWNEIHSPKEIELID